ncbi:hypothetical protein GC173_07035 [bacterium]|nr:hypothetical protein [bacterium]
MPQKSSSNFLTTAAICVSIVAGIALAALLFRGESLRPAGTDQQIAAAASPSPTPAPTAIPSPTAAPAPPAATPAESPMPTPVPVSSVVALVRDHLGKPAVGTEVYFVPRGNGGVQIDLAAAFDKPSTIRRGTSDSSGRVSIELPPGQRWLAGVIAHDAPIGTVQEIYSAPGQETSAEFALPRPFELRGTVVDDVFERVPDVEIEVTWIMKSVIDAKAQRSVRARSDRDGRFFFLLPEAVSASARIVPEGLAPEFLPERSSLELSATEVGQQAGMRIDLALVRAVELRASVISARDDAPVPGAEVQLTLADRDTSGPLPTSWAAISDAAGVATIAGLYPGEYALTVKASGFNNHARAEFRPADDSEPTIRLDPLARVGGRLGLPPEIAGSASVFLINRYDGRRTEPSGSDFLFSDVPPGDWLLGAEAAKDDEVFYGEQLVNVEPGKDVSGLSLELKPVTSITGRLLNPPGELDFPQVLLEADPIRSAVAGFPAEATHSDWRRLPTASVANAGTFVLDNLISGVHYRIIAKNSQTGTMLGAGEAVAGDDKPMALTLGGVGSVRGRVLNSRAEACTGQEVRLTTGLGTLRGEPGDVQTRSTTTSFDGSYVFEDVPVGQVRAYLPDDNTSGRLLSVSAGRATVCDLSCRIWVSIVLDLRASGPTAFTPKEQFLIIPQPGTVVRDQVTEVYLDSLQASLEPGAYTIMRTATMENVPFRVDARLDGSIKLEFKQ